MKNVLVALAALAILTSAQADDDPLEPLNRRIGTWANTTHQKQAVWTPEERTTTGEETSKWILDKKFIQKVEVIIRAEHTWCVGPVAAKLHPVTWEIPIPISCSALSMS